MPYRVRYCSCIQAYVRPSWNHFSTSASFTIFRAPINPPAARFGAMYRRRTLIDSAVRVGGCAWQPV